MRIGTWNLEHASPAGARGAAQLDVLASAELWLLTEVPDLFALPGSAVSRSPARSRPSPFGWAAVASSWPLVPVPARHEGLAMAIVETPRGRVLAAASVLPWRGAGASWPGDVTAPTAQRLVLALDAQLTEVDECLAAHDGLELVWGGDLNQELTGRLAAGTTGGRAAVLSALGHRGLLAVTADAAHLHPDYAAIDHLALPASWPRPEVRVLRPTLPDGRPLSDHAAYVARGFGSAR